MEFMKLPSSLATLVACFAFAHAQYPPPASYQNILNSPLDPNVTVSYKKPPDGTCTTAFATQKQYTGYIGIPPYTLAPIQQNYSINTFFWFVEARQVPEAAPLTIWLNGGPGSSSMVGFFNEVGPCEVVQLSDGSYGTQNRMWGWDRSSNVLFIDQPNQVGFSYDTATKGSLDLLAGELYEPPTPLTSGLPDYMYLNGTFGSANSNQQVPYATTANTTEIAAAATWHFLQTWLAAFPQYNPATRSNYTGSASRYSSNAPVGVNLFAESYGGKYGPTFARYFEQQNQLRSNGSIPSNTTLAVQLESVGIVSGFIDDLVQNNAYPYFAYNNTWGIQAVSQTDELNMINDFSGSGLCHDQILQCRAAMNGTDPEGYGDVEITNDLCRQAQLICANISAPYLNAGYDPYDIRQMLPSPDPPAAYQEYLNNASVLAAIGAQVNYTESSPYVQEGFISTGDTIRGGLIEDLAYLLTQGIRVALIYGDADVICNWYGGEAVSFAIASQLNNFPSQTSAIPLNAPLSTLLPSSYAKAFPAAGYADIVVNSSYIGGAVRQYGNLSFSRIYASGHFVPYFQPETAYTVFTRVILGDDISTGDAIDLASFATVGNSSASHTDSTPYSPVPTCWVRAWNATCSADDTKALLAGNGLMLNGIFYQKPDARTLPSSSVTAGIPGHPVSTASSSETGSPAMSDGSSTGLTGVYTATNTPTPTTGAAAASGRMLEPLPWRVGPLAAVALGFVVGVGVML
ncbi:hypothetical protein LTR12_009279 [Friedmanniomyces endolithicus]|nr:hypothetical protein LTR12_009279 [Friedmanniomyces endolithicus]